jgi:hypothetical protein
VCCQICYASDSIALHFDVWRIHLLDQWYQPTKFHDHDFVVRIDCQVAERSTCGSLYFGVAVLEEEKNRVKRISADFSYISLSDFRKR